ncbi:3526_t:CDS:2 [Ambispora leptoticha]|uniref:Splicing factor YJU2 n=1 Tax=Ambispora leptoticha TaxID=144679 RepID=A0A9N8VDN4_9GLOM|nr:3526_t:CDS:2 [Ambispora leptoticha]
MSERKVLNKYFPPDFDPAAIPRRKQAKDAQHKVRLMTPYAMRCETCGEYIYKGKKFNARKETVEGETYYSIKIFRFYIKCPRCSAEITFKTDPKNTDYVAEHGASRNFEPWREERIAGEEKQLKKEQEEENNPMKALENRTLDSKREMDILDALDEIRTRNARNERVDSDALLDRLIELEEEREKTLEEIIEEEDDKLAKAVFQDANGLSVRKANLDEEPKIDALLSEQAKMVPLPDFSAPIIKKRKLPESDLVAGLIVKKKASSSSKTISTAAASTSTSPIITASSTSGTSIITATTSKTLPITVASTSNKPIITKKAEPKSAPATSSSSTLLSLGDYGSDSNDSE